MGPGAILQRHPHHWYPPPRVPSDPWPCWCHQCYPGYGRAEQLVPSCGLAIKLRIEVLVLDNVDISQCVTGKGLLKELVCP